MKKILPPLVGVFIIFVLFGAILFGVSMLSKYAISPFFRAHEGIVRWIAWSMQTGWVFPLMAMGFFFVIIAIVFTIVAILSARNKK